VGNRFSEKITRKQIKEDLWRQTEKSQEKGAPQGAPFSILKALAMTNRLPI
jgi:hypothetical protein